MTAAEKVKTRLQFGHFFAGLLLLLRKKLKDFPALQAELDANRYEEIGISKEYPGPPHMIGRIALIEALGEKYDELEPEGNLENPRNVHAATAALLKRFIGLIKQNPLVGYGAIAQSESLVPEQYA